MAWVISKEGTFVVAFLCFFLGSTYGQASKRANSSVRGASTLHGVNVFLLFWLMVGNIVSIALVLQSLVLHWLILPWFWALASIVGIWLVGGLLGALIVLPIDRSGFLADHWNTRIAPVATLFQVGLFALGAVQLLDHFGVIDYD